MQVSFFVSCVMGAGRREKSAQCIAVDACRMGMRKFRAQSYQLRGVVRRRKLYGRREFLWIGGAPGGALAVPFGDILRKNRKARPGRR